MMILKLFWMRFQTCKICCICRRLHDGPPKVKAKRPCGPSPSIWPHVLKRPSWNFHQNTRLKCKATFSIRDTHFINWETYFSSKKPTFSIKNSTLSLETQFLDQETLFFNGKPYFINEKPTFLMKNTLTLSRNLFYRLKNPLSRSRKSIFWWGVGFSTRKLVSWERKIAPLQKIHFFGWKNPLFRWETHSLHSGTYFLVQKPTFLIKKPTFSNFCALRLP